MNFTNAKKDGNIFFSNKKINKANYIIPFEDVDIVFGKVTKFLFIPNKKMLKQVVKQYNINNDLLIYGFEDGKYTTYRLKWCL
jgi:hypothetical protein